MPSTHTQNHSQTEVSPSGSEAARSQRAAGSQRAVRTRRSRVSSRTGTRLGPGCPRTSLKLGICYLIPRHLQYACLVKRKPSGLWMCGPYDVHLSLVLSVGQA
eukprot:7388672-Prymnesium_polylepis.1